MTSSIWWLMLASSSLDRDNITVLAVLIEFADFMTLLYI